MDAKEFLNELNLVNEQPFDREKDLFELENGSSPWVIFDQRPKFTSEEFEKLLTKYNTCRVEINDETSGEPITAFALKITGTRSEFHRFCDIEPIKKIDGRHVTSAMSEYEEQFASLEIAMPEIGEILRTACSEFGVDVDLMKKLIALELTHLGMARRYNIHTHLRALINEAIEE